MTDRDAATQRRADPPALTARDIADLVGGRVDGDAGAVVTGIAPLERANAEQLSFLALSSYSAKYAESNAGVVLIAPDLAASPGQARARIIVANPQEALLSVLPRFFVDVTRDPGVHPSATIGRGVKIGEGVTIGPNVVVGAGVVIGDGCWIQAGTCVANGVIIGERSHLYPSVTVYRDTTLGRRVTVHAGARIGSDGFGYVFRDNEHAKIPHVGRCIIEDDVEIGAGTTIDRGSIDDTVIGAGTKIDNLVQIGHNVKVGRLCLIIAQVGISGSAEIEDGVVLAGQAGIGGHLTIGAGARIAGQSGVFGDVPAGESWSGYPARPHRESLRSSAALLKLSQIIGRLEKLLEERGK